MLKNTPGVRELVRNYLGNLPPCTVVANADVYDAVRSQRPSTPLPTIREAIQALAIGSARTSTHRAKEAFAIAATLPELAKLGMKSQVYLAIPEIPLGRIGEGANCRATIRPPRE